MPTTITDRLVAQLGACADQLAHVLPWGEGYSLLLPVPSHVGSNAEVLHAAIRLDHAVVVGA
jgi:hypothetical protein